MNYSFDVDAFDKWYKKVGKYLMLAPFHRQSAKVVIGNQFIQKRPPYYRLAASNTVTGKEEVFPEPFKFGNVIPFTRR